MAPALSEKIGPGLFWVHFCSSFPLAAHFQPIQVHFCSSFPFAAHFQPIQVHFCADFRRIRGIRGYYNLFNNETGPAH